jgi:hypothetical protein
METRMTGLKGGVILFRRRPVWIDLLPCPALACSRPVLSGDAKAFLT